MTKIKRRCRRLAGKFSKMTGWPLRTIDSAPELTPPYVPDAFGELNVIKWAPGTKPAAPGVG
jgi:hypothetical protein